MSPISQTDTPALVPMRIAAAVRSFAERIFEPDGTRLLPRDPDRGRVIAMTGPDLDLRVILDANGFPVGKLSLAALERGRTQLVVRVPVTLSAGRPLLDLALIVPGGALLAARHQLWRGRKSWWLVSSHNEGGYHFALTKQGVILREDTPWVDREERECGLLEAAREFEAAIRAPTPT